MAQFYGKYRGSVVDNVDPLGQGRIRVIIPAVLGDEQSSWAQACVPWVAGSTGLLLTPGVGTSVWVEFEAGDATLPIWTGCMWPIGGSSVLRLSPDGIELTNGQGASILLAGPTVSINHGALEVT